MKRKILSVYLMGILAAAAINSGVYAEVSAEEKAKAASVDVLFVHDTHSHLNEFATIENGESQVLGGFAKLKTLINE